MALIIITACAMAGCASFGSFTQKNRVDEMDRVIGSYPDSPMFGPPTPQEVN